MSNWYQTVSDMSSIVNRYYSYSTGADGATLLFNKAQALINQYSGTTSWKTSTCGYGCSDHASWYKAGYKACFPFETTFSNSNPAIHTASDVLPNDAATLAHAKYFVNLGVAFAADLSTTCQ